MDFYEKIAQAKDVLKLAAELSETYYHAPLIITYSGGKDSDVMLDLALSALKPEQFEVINSHTTVDAPETVYYIRDKFRELEEKGIKTNIKLPMYRGKITSMWELIVINGTFPTSRMRYCCKILKEAATPNRLIACGVREDESKNRSGRGFFSIKMAKKEDAVFLTDKHVREQFESSKKITADLGQKIETPNAYDCKFIEGAKNNKESVCYPIYYFTERDIWRYIREFGLSVNPLYARGYKRVGCVGYPLAGPNNMRREFADYPKYKENYIKAFDRMLENRKAKGKPLKKVNNGSDLMKLWLREDPKQITFEDLFKEADNGENI